VVNSNYNWIGLNTISPSTSFNKNSVDHVYIGTGGVSEGSYHSGMVGIKMRVQSHLSNVEFDLNMTAFNITKSTANYIKGTFEGTTPSPENTPITGSFVFKRTAKNTWPAGLPY